MCWLQSLDLSILRLVRETLRNSLFDWLMPLLSGNALFIPALAVGAVLLAWKGGVRGRVCLLMLTVVLLVGDSLIVGSLKQAIGRARPAGIGEATIYNSAMQPFTSYSMPSSHAANIFSATMVAFLYYRRSLRFMLPLALGVGYSRMYVGAHYPSDVLVGALLGAAYGFAVVWLLDALWHQVGRRWFPFWWASLPSILKPEPPPSDCTESSIRSQGTEDAEPKSAIRNPQSAIDLQWLRLGYVFVGFLLLVRLAYLASGRIELGIDEAYQWVWSKHLALSYYSKPPLIAYVQRLGTALWGDTAFGVRFFSPVSAAVVSLLLLRFLARFGYVRAGFWLVLISASTPLLEVGATVLTVDCLLVLFWTAAMVAGWRAVEQNSLRAWLLSGLWMGLGSLSKYTAFLQPICWAIFFLLCKPARIHLRRPGPYLALGIALLCTLPIWIWNAQHGWITVSHVATNARVDRPWEPSLSYLAEFVGVELGLLNPFFLVAAAWAACAVAADVRRRSVRVNEPGSTRRKEAHYPGAKDQSLLTSAATVQGDPARIVSRRPLAVEEKGSEEIALMDQPAAASLPLYLFCMGAPLFLGYLLFTVHSRVQPNWIAASVTPLFCLMAIYWDTRYRAGLSAVKGWLATGVAFGLIVVIVLHDTNILSRIVRRPIPPALNPLRQVQAWPETARVVGEARKKLLAEGRPVFIICAHYGMTGELSFYLPEAKAGVPDQPLVYYQTSDVPQNQFFFWPGYRGRKGDNAIYVVETSQAHPAPETLRREFARVTDLGLIEILHRGQVFRRLQLFECRDLQ